MRIVIAHEVCGMQGGAELCVRDGLTMLKQRGHQLALVHEGVIRRDSDVIRELCDHVIDASAGQVTEQLINWNPAVIWAHSLRQTSILQGILKAHIPVVRTIHDHASYCMREYRYFPWSRQICTRTPGWSCALTCSILRNRNGRFPIRLGWPADRVKAMKLWATCHQHLANSAYMAKEIARTGVPDNRISVVHPCPQPPTQAAPSDLTAPRAIFTGQLIRGKGADQFIAACAQLTTTDWHGDIIGDGPLRAALEEDVRQRGLSQRITFHGFVDRDQLSQHYRHARVGVIPAMWPEPLGFTGIEFLQHGIPVVANMVGGIGDWLHDGQNGIATTAGDVEAMVKAIDLLLQDQTLAQRLGSYGRTRALKDFSQTHYHDHIEGILTQCAQGQPTP